jgi:hypothetical protein
MRHTVFTQPEFDVFVIGITAVPVLIAAFADRERSCAPLARVVLGALLLFVAAVDLGLLQGLADRALRTPSPLDDLILSGGLASFFYLVIGLVAAHGVRMIHAAIVDHRAHLAVSRDGRVSGAFWSS